MSAKFKIVYNNIVTEPTEAIVTPASREPRIGTGLDKYIHAAAGEKLLAERLKLGAIGPMIVKVTPAFGLKKFSGAKFVLHALGPVWDKRWTKSMRASASADAEIMLEGCYYRILLEAARLKVKTLTIPVMSSGKFGMPMDRALPIAVRAIETFLAAPIKMTVKLVGKDDSFREIARVNWPSLYEERFDAEKEADYKRQVAQRVKEIEVQRERSEMFTLDETLPYFQSVKFQLLVEGKKFNELFHTLWKLVAENERRRKAENRKNRPHRPPPYYLTSRRELVDASGLPESFVKHLLSTGVQQATTSKDRVIALAASLRLPPEYACALVAASGYAFDSPRDQVVAAFIQKGGGRTLDLNRELEVVGESPLVLE